MKKNTLNNKQANEMIDEVIGDSWKLEESYID